MNSNYANIGQLTRTELKVLQAMADHNGDLKKVAKSNFIALTTVKTHVHKIYNKFNVNGKVGAVLEGLKHGLIKVDGISRVEPNQVEPSEAGSQP